MSYASSSTRPQALCDAADLRLLANVAFLAVKMRWRPEADLIYGAVADAAVTPAEALFVWFIGRCELGDTDGAAELLTRLGTVKGVAPDMLQVARCYLACCRGEPQWVDLANGIVRSGPATFGYEAARSMLAEQAGRRR